MEKSFESLQIEIRLLVTTEACREPRYDDDNNDEDDDDEGDDDESNAPEALENAWMMQNS